MAESWARLDIASIPLLAPSFRIFGDNPSRVMVLGYARGASRVNQLDDRWVVDSTDVTYQDEMRPGDAISWIGDYEGGPGLYLWPPSRVLSVEHRKAGGKSRIRSLRDSWLEPLRVGRIEDWLLGMSWKKMWSSKQAVPVSRVVLQWWGLDVWCPLCGDLGNPTSFGLQAPPPFLEPSHIQEWSEFHTPIGSCVDMPKGAMQCPRCGWQWAESVKNSSDTAWKKSDGENYWPEAASVSYELTPAYSRTDLMRLFDVPSFDLLIAVLESDVEPDTYVLERPEGLEIRVGDRGVYLDYPTTVSQIFEYIDELEAEYYSEGEDNECSR